MSVHPAGSTIPLTAADDDWVECVLCQEEVLHDDPDLYSDPSGEWVCPGCVDMLKASGQWRKLS